MDYEDKADQTGTMEYKNLGELIGNDKALEIDEELQRANDAWTEELNEKSGRIMPCFKGYEIKGRRYVKKSDIKNIDVTQSGVKEIDITKKDIYNSLSLNIQKNTGNSAYYYAKVEGNCTIQDMINFCCNKTFMVDWENVNWEWSSASKDTQTKLNMILDELEAGDSLILRRITDLSHNARKVLSVCDIIRKKACRLQYMLGDGELFTLIDYTPLNYENMFDQYIFDFSKRLDQFSCFMASKISQNIRNQEMTSIDQGTEHIFTGDDWNNLIRLKMLLDGTGQELMNAYENEKYERRMLEIRQNENTVRLAQLMCDYASQSQKKTKKELKGKYSASFSRYLDKFKNAKSEGYKLPDLKKYDYTSSDIELILKELLSDAWLIPGTEYAAPKSGRRAKALKDYPPIFIQRYKEIRFQRKRITNKQIAEELSKRDPNNSVTGKQIGVWVKKLDELDDDTIRNM